MKKKASLFDKFEAKRRAYSAIAPDVPFDVQDDEGNTIVCVPPAAAERSNQKIRAHFGRKPRPTNHKALAQMLLDDALGKTPMSDKEIMSKYAYEQFCRPKDQGTWEDILERCRLYRPDLGWPKNIRTLKLWAKKYQSAYGLPEIPSRKGKHK